MEKLSFEEIVSKLELVNVENTDKKTKKDVCEEIRKQIRDWGWECLDDGEDDCDWLENHPEVTEDDCETYAIAERDFLCDNDGYFERINGHDIDWYTFHISFYGVWDDADTTNNHGVFSIYIN